MGERPPRSAEEHLGDRDVELALGHVEGHDRAAMAAHLLRCAACRRDYDELASAIAGVLAAVPAAQPPLGFDERVVARLATERRGRGRSRPPWWRRPAVALAAAAAALVVVVAGVVVGTRGGDGSTELAAGGALVPLRLADGGETVGTVSLTRVDGRDVMVVAFVDAPADVSYTCRLRLADGSVVETEPWPAVPTGAWVVDVPAVDRVSAVDLVVTGTDNVWSTATF